MLIQNLFRLLFSFGIHYFNLPNLTKFTGLKGQSARSKIFVFQLTTVNISQKIPFDPKMGSLAPSVRALEFNQ